MSDSTAADAPLVSELRWAAAAVPDPEWTTLQLKDTLGYRSQRQVRSTGDAPVGLATRVDLIGPTGATRGLIGLVAGGGRPSPEGVLSGWSSLEIVVADLDEVMRRASAAGWTLVGGPVTIDLSDRGSNVHRAAAFSVGGIILAFTMAVTQPEGREFPRASDLVGHVFAAHLRTSAPGRAHMLLSSVLRMRPLLEERGGHTFLHEFWGVAEGLPIGLTLYRGSIAGTGFGSVEVQEWPESHLEVHPSGTGIIGVVYSAPDPAEARRAVANGDDPVDDGVRFWVDLEEGAWLGVEPS